MSARDAHGPGSGTAGISMLTVVLLSLTVVFVGAATSASRAVAAQNDCGQPVSDGATPTASDALFILGAAVGLQTCDPCVCDTNASGSITAGDALATLNAAVGVGGVLACQPCEGEIELDCVREGYPCSLADADPDAWDKVVALLPLVWDARAAGTMEDAKSFLAAHPDVSDVVGNDVLIRFMVDGMTPVFFHDRTVGTPAPELAATPSPSAAAVPTHAREVVGDDSTGDGTVDQRDAKRALVLAPYEYQFAPYDESVTIADRLENLEPYAGNVVLKRNPTESDRNIVLEDFLSFGSYDAIFISTHGSRVCDILPDLSNRCEVWVSTRVLWDKQDRPQFSVNGIAVNGYFDPEENQSRTQVEIALTSDFWRAFYNGTLDNRLVSFSACETGNAEGAEIARAMGGEDFVMMGWTELTNTPEARAVAEVFTEELGKGLTASQALQEIMDRGMVPYINSENVETTFERFAPHGGDVRLVELPRLIFKGATMSDNVNIMELVGGTIGDQSADTLRLELQVDGVTENTKSQFHVRYRVGDQDVAGTYDLQSATLVSGYEYRYEVAHDVALGFPLQPGDLPIEVIVDLPEGGDSRFSVNPTLASCSFSVEVGGDTTAVFDGPAQFEVSGDGSVTIALLSRGYINADPPTSISASFTSGPGNPLAPGTYDILYGDIHFDDPPYVAYYADGFEGADCGSCGGSMTFDSVIDEQSISGSASLTLVRNLPPPEGGELPTVTMTVTFNAAFASQFDGSSPYAQCAAEYGQ